MDIIKYQSKNYDFWLVAAGELGRIYTGEIKERGGRAVDIGFVVEFWTGETIHPRITPFLKRCPTNRLALELTKEGMKYVDWI